MSDEVANRGSETQLQVSGNLYFIMYLLTKGVIVVCIVCIENKKKYLYQ